MNVYANDIYAAVLTFPLIAALISLPYAAYQYRKFGAISVYKLVLFFMFVLYLQCTYFLVIMPLPDDLTALHPNAANPRLTLFSDYVAIFKEVEIDPLSPASWVAALKAHCVYTKIFNILMTVPLGVFLGYFFHRKWWQVLIIGFCTTLFFEISQLTGLFGLSLHPYRLFDVNDLLDNTFGTMLGFWVSLPLKKHLPDPSSFSSKAVQRGHYRASSLRRAVSFMVDMTLSVVLTVAVGVAAYMAAGDFPDWAFFLAVYIVTGLIYMVVPAITKGQTLGQKLVKLRITTPEGEYPGAARCALRYALLVWFFLLGPIWVMWLAPTSESVTAYANAMTILAVVNLIYMAWILTLIFRAAEARVHNHPFVMVNGIMSGTRIMTCDQAVLMQRLVAEHHANLDVEVQDPQFVDTSSAEA